MRISTFGPIAACLAAMTLAPEANAQFLDDFESYTAGTPIEGQGGWENWTGCGASNTLFSTVTSAQAFGGANSLMVSAGADNTHPLNGPYTQGVFTFSMQTYVPNTHFGNQYMILLSEHDACASGGYAWASQVRFDGASGMVVSDQFVGNLIPAPGIGSGDQAIIFDQWVEYKVEIDLGNNTQTNYYNGVAMWEGDWDVNAAGVPAIDALDLYPAGGPGTVGDVFYDDISLVGGIVAGPIGTNYCMANNNGTGVPTEISAVGSPAVADNDVTLSISNATTNAFAFFLTSQTQGLSMNPGGSAGNLCLGGAIGRYVGPGQIQNTGSAGQASLVLDLTTTPTPTGLVSVQAGETWNFVCWHRDSIGGSPTSNFSDGIEITFQ